MRARPLRGLRGRLALGTILVLTTAIILADIAAFIGLKQVADQRTHESLNLALDRSVSPSLATVAGALDKATINRLAPPGAYIALYSTNGELLVEHLPTDLGGYPLPVMPGPEVIGDGPTLVTASGGQEGVIAVSRILAPEDAFPVTVDGKAQVIGAAVAGFTNYANVQTFRQFVQWQVWIALILIVLAAAATLAVLRAGLKPLRTVADTAREISSGDLSRRIPITDPSTEIGTVSMALNEAFAQAEDSEQRMRTFIADASHELRTPLATILGWADLYLLDGVREWDDVDAAMVRIRAESARMTDLVDQLLALARSDSSDQGTYEELDFSELTDDVVSAVAITAPHHILRPSSDANGRAIVMGDLLALRQLVTNLIANALVHTPAGTIITVEVARDPAEPPHVTLTVTDNGPGMTPEQLALAFDRFWRAESGPSSAAGSGLGLSIVRSTVQAHHGTVSLYSEEGEGLTVVVRLPLAMSTD